MGRLGFGDDHTQNGFTLTLETAPTNGVVQLDPLSSTPIVYSSNENYFGTDVFSVALHDDNNPSKSVVLPLNVIINPINDAPVLSSSIKVQANEGIPFSYNIAWTDVDHGSGHIVTVSDIPGWVTYDNLNHSIQGTPLWADYKEEPYSVIVKIEDPAGASSSYSV